MMNKMSRMILLISFIAGYCNAMEIEKKEIVEKTDRKKSKKPLINFDENAAGWPIAYSIGKNDLFEEIGRSKEGIFIVQLIKKDLSPLDNPVFGILSKDDEGEFLVKLAPERSKDQGFTKQQISIEIPSTVKRSFMCRKIWRRIGHILVIPLIPFAAFGIYKTTIATIAWYKQKYKKS